MVRGSPEETAVPFWGASMLCYVQEAVRSSGCEEALACVCEVVELCVVQIG